MKYRIVLLSASDSRPVAGEIEELYSTLDLRIGLSAARQMPRLLSNYDRSLTKPRYFSDPIQIAKLGAPRPPSDLGNPEDALAAEPCPRCSGNGVINVPSRSLGGNAAQAICPSCEGTKVRSE